MTLDISVSCVRDGLPAQPQVHHGRPENPQMGRGMGGSKLLEHERYDLCDGCHQSLHRKEWTFKVDGGWVTGENADGSTFERPLYFDEQSPSPAWWPDAKLGEQWERADAATLKARATIAHVYKRRWGWGKGWAKRAADVMGGGAHGTGQQISERTVRRCANIWKHWEGNWEMMKQLASVTIAYAVADAEDTDRALEIAQEQIAAGKKAKEVVALIEGKVGNIGQTERCVCGEGEGCGHVHSKKGV